MSRLLLIFILHVLINAPVAGQAISGYVRDSLGEGIPFASVVATACRNEQVLAFTTTDHLGQYQLRVATDCDSILLTARGLGYRPAIHTLTSRPLPLRQDFLLLSTALAIREIVVRDKPPPVVGRRDTTEYDVAAFSDSTEFSVEDLLKKIPGVRVNENGTITYNGKTVERVLLEGDDLFSSNYPLATRNLRADMVGKVQMIDRYQENQLLKSVQESDRLVMNLTFRPDRKRSLSGSITGGLGYGDEWKGRGHTNLFSLSRKDKFYLIANANNTGENALSDVEWMSRGGFLQPGHQVLQDNPLHFQPVVHPITLEEVGLPPAYTQTNRSGLVYVGEVLPVSPNFKVKISGWIGKERLQQDVEGTTRYLLDSSTLEIMETQNTYRQSGLRHVQAATEYFSNNKKHGLRSYMTFNHRASLSHLNVVRNQVGEVPFQIVHRADEGLSDAFGGLEYTLKKSETLAFQLISKNAWYCSTSLLAPRYAWYPPFFGLDTAFTQLQQTVDQRQGESLLLLRLMARRKSVQWLLETGSDWQWGELSSNLQLQNGAAEAWSPTADYRNQLKLYAPQYFMQGSATRSFGPLLLRPRLQLRYQPVQLTAPGLSVRSLSPWAVEPRLDVRYTPGERSVIAGFYNFRQEMPAMSSLYPAYIFTDYQSLERGQADLTWLSGHQAGLTYRYNNRLRQFSWNLNGSWRRQVNEFGLQYHINPFLIVQEAFRPVSSAAYALNGGGDHYFKAISMRFALGGGFSARREGARINSEALRQLDTRNYLVHGSCGTAFDGWVNAVVDSRVNHAVIRAPAGYSLQTTYWFSTLQISIKPASRFHLKMSVHHTANHSARTPYRHFYAADGLALLRLPKWHSELEVTAFNLLGSRYFERASADAFLQSRTAVTAVRRFILLSWSVNL